MPVEDNKAQDDAQQIIHVHPLKHPFVAGTSVSSTTPSPEAIGWPHNRVVAGTNPTGPLRRPRRPPRPTPTAGTAPLLLEPSDPEDMPDVTVRRGVGYRETPEGAPEADVYLPAGGTDRPAVVLIHGGGWETNHHGMLEPHLRDLAGRGYVGVELTHRLSGEATFPAPVADVAYALRWLADRADEYGLDPHRVAVGGHSSGAHLAALAALTAASGEFVPDDAPEVATTVAAAVLLNGPFELERLGRTDPARLFLSGEIRRLFGGPWLEHQDAYRRASCSTHVDGTGPPALVMTGTHDEEVPTHESQLLADHLEHAGVEVELLVATGGDHFCFTDGGSHYETGMERIAAFLDEHV